MTQWASAAGCRHQLDPARCGFIIMENKDSKIAAVRDDSVFNKNKDIFDICLLCVKAVSNSELNKHLFNLRVLWR